MLNTADSVIKLVKGGHIEKDILKEFGCDDKIVTDTLKDIRDSVSNYKAVLSNSHCMHIAYALSSYSLRRNNRCPDVDIAICVCEKFFTREQLYKMTIDMLLGKKVSKLSRSEQEEVFKSSMHNVGYVKGVQYDINKIKFLAVENDDRSLLALYLYVLLNSVKSNLSTRFTDGAKVSGLSFISTASMYRDNRDNVVKQKFTLPGDMSVWELKPKYTGVVEVKLRGEEVTSDLDSDAIVNTPLTTYTKDGSSGESDFTVVYAEKIIYSGKLKDSEISKAKYILEQGKSPLFYSAATVHLVKKLCELFYIRSCELQTAKRLAANSLRIESDCLFLPPHYDKEAASLVRPLEYFEDVLLDIDGETITLSPTWLSVNTFYFMKLCPPPKVEISGGLTDSLGVQRYILEANREDITTAIDVVVTGKLPCIPLTELQAKLVKVFRRYM